MKHRLKIRGEGLAKALSVVLLLFTLSLTLLVAELAVIFLWDADSSVNISVVLPWLLLISVIIASFMDCFNFGGKRFYNLLFSIYVSTLLSCIVVLALPYVAIGAQVSKKVMLAMFLLSLPLLPVWLRLSRRIYFLVRPPFPTLLITSDSSEAWLMDKINRYSNKYHVTQAASPDDPALEQYIAESGAVVLGKLGTLEKESLLGICAAHSKHVLIRPEYTDVMMINAQTEQFDDLMMISVNRFGLTGGQKFFKRTGDLAFSIIALIPALPVTLLLALAVFLSDRHNPFFFQERLTRGGRKYNVIKLRTMIPDAEKAAGPVLAEKDDPRITKIGRFLRSTRLDELPQLLNILKGDMSIVGPRPERQFFYEKYCEDIPEFRHRLAVKGGLTGLAQVWGRYSTDPYEKLMLDLMYIQSYSMMLDVKLIIETIRVIFEKEASQ